VHKEVEQNIKNLISKIPKEVSYVTDTLEKAGFEAYLVGGCVRDLLMGREPKDWDITTNAKPDQIISLFEKTVYENTFGTVMVIQEDVSQETLRQIEVTPYRIETEYSDFRHPDEVKFSEKLEDDLKRRDFTWNAMALSSKGQLVDIYQGQRDIKDKVLRTVGDADDRFNEDALRMLRAVRLSLQLDFSVSHETTESILKNADLIKKISSERIRDEFSKIIMSSNPSVGIVMLQ
jgi:tRNA nucleotidyltransferase/poly(A) polymerase